jgi:hypothetical protein
MPKQSNTEGNTFGCGFALSWTKEGLKVRRRAWRKGVFVSSGKDYWAPYIQEDDVQTPYFSVPIEDAVEEDWEIYRP